jgi:hypothetical protein
MTMPEDLAARIRENEAALDAIVERLKEFEQRQASNAQDLARLRHDFNNVHMAVRVLMEEVDERVPVPGPGPKKAK